jgi:Leucine-rich repeat (LRR) protein
MSISNLINGTQALPSLVNLNGEVQDAINRLVMLKLNRLILDGFDLVVLPSELAELMRLGILPSIEQLFLQRNKLRTLSPEINLHKRLTQIHLQSNELTNLPEELGELTLLEELDISNNKFAHVPLPVCHMVTIKRLHLQNNLITKIPLEIGELQNLEQLNLSYNQLTELPLEFGRLTQLTTLKLDTNKLTMFPREFGLLINLHFLSAVQNNIVHLPPEFGELAKLETLLLHENPQLSILPTSIIRLSNLRKMTLDLPVLIAPQFISAGPKMMHHFVLFCQRLRLHINSRQHWVPDEASKNCSRCNTIFTMLTRRVSSLYSFSF